MHPALTRRAKAVNRIGEHLHPGVENSGFRSAAGTTPHCMGAMVTQMPPTGAEPWVDWAAAA